MIMNFHTLYILAVKDCIVGRSPLYAKCDSCIKKGTKCCKQTAPLLSLVAPKSLFFLSRKLMRI